jgi:hypothetical protein
LKKLLSALFLTLIVSGPARADKLIWIPTADIQKLAVEYMTDTGGDENVLTGQIGFRQFELFGRRYSDFPGDDESWEIGGQLQILPEGFATPGLSIGVWDVADDSPRGRRIFGVVSQTLSPINWLPGISNTRVHAGLGSGSLASFFLGGQITWPFGLTLLGEFDSDDVNLGLWWTPIKPLRLKVESWDGDVFVGAQFVSPL